MLVITDNEKQEAPASAVETQLLAKRIMVEINIKLSSGERHQELLDFMFESLDLVIPYDRIGIALVEGTGDQAQLRVKWVRSKVPATHITLNYSAPVLGSSLQKILETGQPRIINDLIEYSADHPKSLSTKLIIEDGIRSSLTCPLRSENRRIGVVFFSSCKPNTYRNEHVETFLEIADELSVIIDHGRLRDEFDAYAAQTQNVKMILEGWAKNPV